MNSPKETDISTYIYDLPDNRIARHPPAQRDACKLLVAGPDGIMQDTVFSALPQLLPDDALLIYNDTKVINARIRMHKPTGAAIEIFCLEPVSPADYERNFASTGPVTWRCMVGNAKRWKDGALTRALEIDGDEIILTATRTEDSDRTRLVKFAWNNPKYTFARIIAAAGVIPIPPYLNRETEESDKNDYQTVFSRFDGSVAAPTAGLHFTDGMLQAIDRRGIRRRSVTLHVGAGTFQPVTTQSVGDHPMHAEYITVSRSLIAELAQNTSPVFAVGTTSVRTLESLYHIGCMISQNRFEGELPQWYWAEKNHPQLPVDQALKAILARLERLNEDALVASTRIMIAPGYRYRMVNGLITNFHQPGSTLLLLVSALIGETWRQVYAHALDNGYRFLSYGDACLFSPASILCRQNI